MCASTTMSVFWVLFHSALHKPLVLMVELFSLQKRKWRGLGICSVTGLWSALPTPSFYPTGLSPDTIPQNLPLTPRVLTGAKDMALTWRRHDGWRTGRGTGLRFGGESACCSLEA